MRAEEGLRWAGIIFAVLGSILAAWSAASVPLKVALKMPSIWGVGNIPAGLVLEQKALSSGALAAILLTFTSQLLAPLFAGRPDGWWILAVSLPLALVIVAITVFRSRTFRKALQRMAAQTTISTGELHDVEFVRNPTTAGDFVEVVGIFYGRKRREREPIDEYRERVAERIRAVAGQEGRRSVGMREGPQRSEREPTLHEPYEDLVRWQGDLGGPDNPTAAHARARLQTRLTLEVMSTIGTFSRTTGRLSKVLIWLTVVLVVLTIVLLGIGIQQIQLMR